MQTILEFRKSIEKISTKTNKPYYELYFEDNNELPISAYCYDKNIVDTLQKGQKYIADFRFRGTITIDKVALPQKRS